MELFVDNENGTVKNPSLLQKVKAKLNKEDDRVIIQLSPIVVQEILARKFWSESSYLLHYKYAYLSLDEDNNFQMIFNNEPI